MCQRLRSALPSSLTTHPTKIWGRDRDGIAQSKHERIPMHLIGCGGHSEGIRPTIAEHAAAEGNRL